MLPIFIPSRSRWQRSLTLERLGPAVLRERGRFVALVVPSEQRAMYEPLAKQHGAKVICEQGVKGIAATRKLVGEICAERLYDKFIMLDDDLRFMHRAADNDWHLLQNNSEDCRQMLVMVEAVLDNYAHAGISPRQANNQMDVPAEYNTRMVRVLAFRTKEFNKCQHGRVAVMEDFDVTLQLLAKGYPNILLTYWTQDQYATNLPGGCSEYRTLALHERNVKKMQALWGDTIVRLRHKKNKTGVAHGLSERLEATIYWKKALNLYERELT